MNFELNETQAMLRDAVGRYIDTNYSFEQRQQAVSSDEGFSVERWAEFAQLGWLSVPFAEEFGGMGGDAVDVMVLMEALGRGLVAEPWQPTVFQFGGLLQAAGGERASTLIQQVVEGAVQGTFAWQERQSGALFHDVETTLTSSADGYTLAGEKAVVMNGAAADYAVVTARSAGKRTDAEGVSLVLVDLKAEGVSRRVMDYMDGQKVATLSFDNVTLPADALLGELGAGLSVIDAAMPLMLVALCAEGLGVIEHLNATTLEYTRTRKQFGKAIGSFQVLQHRQVDTFASAVNMRSMLLRAACHLTDEGVSDEECRRDLAALKVTLGKSGRHIGAEAIQLHGGMGMTDELDVGHYVKRLLVLNQLMGDEDYHLNVLMSAA